MLELADTDLKKFLYQTDFETQCSNVAQLLKEASDLLDALRWLHAGLSLAGRMQVCCHMDLKLDNILVYDIGNPDFPVGRWKISDFGISSMTEPEKSQRPKPGLPKASNPTPAGTIARIASTIHRTGEVLTTAPRVPGPYSAPEVEKGSQVGPPSDIWSFGCILFQILVRGVDSIESRKISPLIDYFQTSKPPHTSCGRD